MLLCSNALFVTKVIGPRVVYQPLAATSPEQLLTNLCQFDILQSGPGRGPNAIRSIEPARVHLAARRRSCGVAARGAGAAIGDAVDRVHRHWVAGVRRLPVTLVLPGPERNRLRRRTERGD